MNKYGVNSLTLNWLRLYLKERRLHIRVVESLSDPFACSGVPQGSYIGLVIFFIYVQDSNDGTTDGVEYHLYTDDLKLSRPLTSCTPATSLIYRVTHVKDRCVIFRYRARL